MDRQAGRQTDRQTDRQTFGPTFKYKGKEGIFQNRRTDKKRDLVDTFFKVQFDTRQKK